MFLTHRIIMYSWHKHINQNINDTIIYISYLYLHFNVASLSSIEKLFKKKKEQYENNLKNYVHGVLIYSYTKSMNVLNTYSGYAVLSEYIKY